MRNCVPSNVAEPFRAIAHDAPLEVPVAVAVHVTVVPVSVPLAVPAIAIVPMQVAVNDPLPVVPLSWLMVQ